MKDKCLAKVTQLYFTEAGRNVECAGRMFALPDFWAWHPVGEKDAAICESHVQIALAGLPKNSFLVEKIHEAKRQS